MSVEGGRMSETQARPAVDLVELRSAMMVAAMPLPVSVEYDEDGGGECSFPYSRWAYRIPGICNVAEEVDETWPGLVPDPEGFDGRDVCPRSEYIAKALNAMPELLDIVSNLQADLARVTAERDAMREVVERAFRNLRPYLQHTKNCGQFTTISGECGCGLQDAQREIVLTGVDIRRARLDAAQQGPDCLCKHAIAQVPGEATRHDPRCAQSKHADQVVSA